MLGWAVADGWDYCGRSPCTRLIDALGRWIYGNPADGSYVTVICRVDVDGASKSELSEIRYCPFCGCRLEKLEFKAGHVVEISDS